MSIVLECIELINKYDSINHAKIRPYVRKILERQIKTCLIKLRMADRLLFYKLITDQALSLRRMKSLSSFMKRAESELYIAAKIGFEPALQILHEDPHRRFTVAQFGEHLWPETGYLSWKIYVDYLGYHDGILFSVCAATKALDYYKLNYGDYKIELSKNAIIASIHCLLDPSRENKNKAKKAAENLAAYIDMLDFETVEARALRCSQYTADLASLEVADSYLASHVASLACLTYETYYQHNIALRPEGRRLIFERHRDPRVFSLAASEMIRELSTIFAKIILHYPTKDILPEIE